MPKIDGAWVVPEAIDEYRLVRPLGEGAIGQVFLGHDTLLERAVAVKLIPSRDTDPQARERFFAEARAVARLHHPNVVAIYRVGTIEGHPYLVSEFVAGRPLDQLPRPISAAEALPLALGLARGLAAAHRSGVVHRDIKPANAILSSDGEPKLLDFGLAKLLGARVLSPEAQPVSLAGLDFEAPQAVGATAVTQTFSEEQMVPVSSPHDLTRTGAVLGTPLYMAPEVWRGEAASASCDVYSLGALLYELFTGVPPHQEEDAERLRAAVLYSEPKPVSARNPLIDARLGELVDRCLRREPRERFASAEHLRDALDQLMPGKRRLPIPEGNPYRGLQAFEAEHQALFFGRDAEVRSLVERLRTEPLVLVTGDSGVGKSSLCRAGVVPHILQGALRAGLGWSVATLVPGRHPLRALAVALGLPPEAGEHEILTAELRHRAVAKVGLLLLMDQLEELVTLSEPLEAATTAELLVEVMARRGNVRVLGTVRADHLGRVASLPGLGDEFPRPLFLLRPLSSSHVKEAIEGPARALGVRFETAEMVDQLASSAASTAGGLPLLQFALAELWDARDRERQMIPAAALSLIGGVTGALARHADGVLAGFSFAQRQLARRIFVQLVTKEGTSHRLGESELLGGESSAGAVLGKLVRGRLLMVRNVDRGAVYEVAHEALVAGWSTLSDWLEEDADSLEVRNRISAAAGEWRRLGASREALWRDRQLEEASRVAPERLSQLERGFLMASRRWAAVRRWRLRLITAAVALALGATWGTVHFQHRAELRRRVTERIEAAESPMRESRALAAQVDALRAEALSRFRERKLEEGEVRWAEALSVSTQLERAQAQASKELEGALMLDGDAPGIRARFAELLYERALLAERNSNLSQRDELLQRLSLSDPTLEFRRRWDAPAFVSVETVPPGARVSLERIVPGQNGRRVTGATQDFGISPLSGTRLEPGAYVLVLEAPGRLTVRHPLFLTRAEKLRLRLWLPNEASVPPGFVYIAPGRFLFGSADESQRKGFFNTLPLQTMTTGGFLISRTETTFAQWFEYLATLSSVERRALTPSVGNSAWVGALGLLPLPGGAWRLRFQPRLEVYTAKSGEPIRYRERERRSEQDWLQFPVAGVSLHDAQAYARWRGTHGVPGARLCTEFEWERAARGADDRPFPSGDRLQPDDANFDETYHKRPMAFGPDQVGSHPDSRSPFGVDDLAGNVWEWVTSSLREGESVARGGSYYLSSIGLRTENRERPEPTLRDSTVGFRLCASVPE